MEEKQYITLYRNKDTRHLPRWARIVNKIVGANKAYIADFFSPPITTEGEDFYEGGPKKTNYECRVISSERTNLILKSLMALEKQDMKGIEVLVDKSFFEPRIVITQDEIPYDANNIKFLFEIYGKSRNIQVKIDFIQKNLKLEKILNKYGVEICCVSFIVLPIIITSSISKGLRIYEKYFNKRKQEKDYNKILNYDKS